MRTYSSIACVVSLLAGAGVASANQINVAILSATGSVPNTQDIISKISANAPFLNISVLAVDTATPNLTTLDLYQAVMVVGSNPFLDSTTLGNNLKAYIDQGHGIVMTASSNYASNCTYFSVGQLCGAFQDSDYWAIEPGTQKQSQASLGTVYLPGDPLLAGVTTFNGGSLATRITGTVHTGANRIADWSDGTPLLVTRTFASGAKEVAVNFYPVSSDKWTGLWVSSTDGGKILGNAFTIAAGATGSSDGDTPEPATYLLTATGFGLVGLLLRRRQRTLQSGSAQGPRNR